MRRSVSCSFVVWEGGYRPGARQSPTEFVEHITPAKKRLAIEDGTPSQRLQRSPLGTVSMPDSAPTPDGARISDKFPTMGSCSVDMLTKYRH